MLNIQRTILQEYNDLLTEIEQLETVIQEYPKGSLKKKVVNNRDYWYLQYREGTKVINEYIRKEDVKSICSLLEKRDRKIEILKTRKREKDWIIHIFGGQKAVDDMKEHSNKLTIKDVSRLLGKEDETLIYGQFLDDFYSEQNKEYKYELLAEEPIFQMKHKLFLCILAATAEKLANENNLPIPKWTKNQKYYLSCPFYAFDTQNSDYQHYLIKSTPEEFKKRNIMYGEDVMMRC